MCSHNLLVVCGPTASGKTTLAVTLALHCKAEIISADSRQVYRGLDIGSGKDLNEYRRNGHTIPVHLIDITDPAELYTVSHFQKDFFSIFGEIAARNMLPLLCGGTGLYIESVLRDYHIPTVPENPELRRELSARPVNILMEELRRLDPERLKHTDTSSKKRIIRAIEVATAGTTPPDTTQPQNHPPLTPVILCTRWERPVLHSRITGRLYRRLDEGMIGEVHRLRREGVSDERLIMMGMEYRFITRYLRGELTLQTMIETLQHEIFLLSKRQESYFRGMQRRCNTTVHWIDNADEAAAIAIVNECFSR